ncbi:ABC transporter permease [Natrarchaeobius chitinivorans]|uniref:ABC transporter permease n=1 Tax=Natrarchaeobius chitinivorans TaxID=1679083 RepID=A0A3N6N8T5_NATCH|nr:ABC transporter permease [Natrarchaeobius chitinivorans]RQG94902.1 ABC transporter permease [Natrarchaeobius chitinivorans]
MVPGIGVSEAFLAGLLGATLTAATPLILAGLGELVAERSGVLNLGVEGIMLMSALLSLVVTVWTGSVAAGFVAGALVGALAGWLHAFLCISLKADQVISGLMITFIGIALTVFFGSGWVGRSVDGLPTVYFPVIGEPLSNIPIIGSAIFYATPTDFLALLLVPIFWYGIFHTNVGLELIAVGESAGTADTLGVPVFRVRYLATILGGTMAGLAGAHLLLAWINQWSPMMTAGMGWIAIALCIVGRWRPFYVLGVAMVFGFFKAMQIRIQGFDVGGGTVGAVLSDPAFFAMYPYLATVVVLWWAAARESEGSLGMPSEMVVPYKREE